MYIVIIDIKRTNRYVGSVKKYMDDNRFSMKY